MTVPITCDFSLEGWGERLKLVWKRAFFAIGVEISFTDRDEGGGRLKKEP